jgi:bifunctional non-homologous end joining protein LigD
MPRLDAYRAKRDFTRTSEPPPAEAGPAEDRGLQGGVFVVQKHAARRLHYDLRLEHGGVLWSWAVTRGPSLDPADKRLAVQTEDHPLDYQHFEGTIPKGEYGGGSVIIWDRGRWTPVEDPVRGMQKGHISFALEGEKLGGRWHLVRLKPRKGESRDNWLLTKAKDEAVRTDGDILAEAPRSVVSGRTVEEVAEGVPAPEPGQVLAKKPFLDRSPAATRGRTGKAAKARPTDAPLPAFLPPQLATLQERPVSGQAWVHEIKFDGYRVQARIDHGEVRLLTRSGLDWTPRFGGRIAEALAALPCETALVDGEIVVAGEDGISSFSALQNALSEGRTGGMVLFAFDLMHLDGRDLTGEPLLARKEELAQVLAGSTAEALRYSEHFVEPGQRMLDHACRMGLEGVISKRADAPYRSGRSEAWVKSKCGQAQEFVVAGYVPSKGSGRGLGSLVVGYREGEALKPAGRVGTGFTVKTADDLKRRLDALASETSPYEGKAGRERGVVWVRPELVVEVSFANWTADGNIRHAVFKGLREDKPAGDVVQEVAAPVPPKAAATEPPAPSAKAPRRKAKAPAVPETSVRLTSPDKVLWPDCGLTKAGLLAHYAAVWPLMAPYVTNRPLSLVRAPNGIAGHSFFQKHAMPGMHEAIHRQQDVDGESLLFIRDFDGMAGLVQLGVVEVHVWGSRVDQVEQPDQLIFDLDPDEGLEGGRMIEAALTLRRRLDELGLASFAKTSGGKGYHVVVPVKPSLAWPEAKEFARTFARAIVEAEPALYTATLSKKARRGRIFVDYLRNGRGATAIAPYSTRARPGAPVAVPIPWSAVEQGLAPNHFRVGMAVPAMDAKADPWLDYGKQARTLAAP